MSEVDKCWNKYRSIKAISTTHWSKLKDTILRTNPSVIQDYLQHKLAILYLREYLNNPSLVKERRIIFERGRVRKYTWELTTENHLSLLDHVLAFPCWPHMLTPTADAMLVGFLSRLRSHLIQCFFTLFLLVPVLLYFFDLIRIVVLFNALLRLLLVFFYFYLGFFQATEAMFAHSQGWLLVVIPK